MRAGFFYALSAAVLFGASTPFSKILLLNIDPWMLAGVLYLGSGVGLAAISLVSLLLKRRLTEPKLAKRDVPYLAGATIFGGVFAPVLLMQGLARTPASSASLYLNFEAVFTAVIAWTIFREHFDRRIFVGMLAIVLGGTALAWSGLQTVGGLTGPILIAAACLCWGIDNSFTREVSASDPVQTAMIKSFVAGGMNLVLSLGAGPATWPALSALATGSLVGFVGYGLSLTLFILALRDIGTARTGAFFSVAPFIGAAVSVFVGDTLTFKLVLAALLMGFGVWLHITESHEHEHEHDELWHEHAHEHDEHHDHKHDHADEPLSATHTHRHRHTKLRHSHRHFPDLHHRHGHEGHSH